MWVINVSLDDDVLEIGTISADWICDYGKFNFTMEDVLLNDSNIENFIRSAVDARSTWDAKIKKVAEISLQISDKINYMDGGGI
jgi:hypothetical protein